MSSDGAEGISGLELQLDAMLTGAEGEVLYERAKVDGGGAEVCRRYLARCRGLPSLNTTVI